MESMIAPDAAFDPLRYYLEEPVVLWQVECFLSHLNVSESEVASNFTQHFDVMSLEEVWSYSIDFTGLGQSGAVWLDKLMICQKQSLPFIRVSIYTATEL